MDEVEEDTAEEVMEEVAACIKTGLPSHMSPVNLNIHSEPHSQMIQGKGSLRNRYAQSSWQIKRGAPPALSVMERTMRTG